MMKKKGTLIFAQVDHVSGEITGYAVGRIIELGAHNVQLIPTITKKNRPGNILIIDADPSKEKAISEFMARELGVSGYHRIDTQHIFHRVSFVERKVRIKSGSRSKSMRCTLKIIGESTKPLCVEIEHDFLVGIQKEIRKEFNSTLSLSELRGKIETGLSDLQIEEVTIEV
ncbi:MAG: nickel insertion protein [Nitrospirota bacterium]